MALDLLSNLGFGVGDGSALGSGTARGDTRQSATSTVNFGSVNGTDSLLTYALLGSAIVLGLLLLKGKR